MTEDEKNELALRQVEALEEIATNLRYLSSKKTRYWASSFGPGIFGGPKRTTPAGDDN